MPFDEALAARVRERLQDERVPAGWLGLALAQAISRTGDNSRLSPVVVRHDRRSH
jgi:hypothetical protein